MWPWLKLVLEQPSKEVGAGEDVEVRCNRVVAILACQTQRVHPTGGRSGRANVPHIMWVLGADCVDKPAVLSNLHSIGSD
jgi:hypothetical protein